MTQRGIFSASREDCCGMSQMFNDCQGFRGKHLYMEKIAKHEINPSGTAIVRAVVLWANDEEHEEGDLVFPCKLRRS